MIADAERHREEDRRLREVTDARNELDAATYQVEHLLAEGGESLPVHVKARAGERGRRCQAGAQRRAVRLDRLRT